jgi:hypothetical protein
VGFYICIEWIFNYLSNYGGVELEQLKSAVMEFVKEGCAILCQIQIPLKNWSRIEVFDDDVIGWHWMPKQEIRPDLVALSFFFARNTPPFNSSDLILQTLERDQTLLARLHAGEREVEGWRSSELHLKIAIWQAVLAPYVELCWAKHQRVLLDDALFETVWEKHLAHIKLPAVVTETRLFPLTTLKMVWEKMELEPGLTIRPLWPEEIEAWLNTHFLLFGTTFRFNEINHLQCAIEATYHRLPEHYSIQGMVKRMHDQNAEATTIFRALSTLRLITNTKISIPFEQTHSRGLLYQEMSVAFRQARNFGSRPEWHSLSALEADQAVEIWEQTKSHPKMQQYNLAFSRWSGAWGKEQPDDKLIDYWIGLESLFTQDSTQELRFRAPLRIAAFLGQEGAEMVKIYRDMQHSYDWRSAVVHGSISDSKKATELDKKGDLPTVVAYTKDYLREAILRLLRSDVALKPLKIESDNAPKKKSETETEIDLLMRLGKEGLS